MKITKFERNLFTMAKLLLMWEIGGCVYYGIELLYRGHSHISMFMLGGLCLVLIGLLNELFTFKMSFELQLLIGDVIVTSLEFVTGYIVNIKMGLNVWDYSSLHFNIMGQVCPQFMLLWIPIVALAIYVDDLVRHVYLFEEKPSYIFCIKNWLKKKYPSLFKNEQAQKILIKRYIKSIKMHIQILLGHKNIKTAFDSAKEKSIEDIKNKLSK